MRFVKFVSFVTVLALATFAGFVTVGTGLLAHSGQFVAAAPPPAQQPPQVRTSSIAGQVIDGDTGAAVPGAIVQIQMRTLIAAAGPGRAGGRGGALSAAEVAASNGQDFVMSDGDGQFVFHNLPKGPARLAATASGYVERPGGIARPIQITADGQHLSNVRLRLVKTASVSGVIVDEAGEPLVGVQVRAMRRDVPAGAPRYSLLGNSRTDDRGLYRLDGLVPGQFFVVLPQTQTTVPVANLEKTSDSFGGILGANNPFLEALTGGMQTNMLGMTGVRVGDQMWQSGSGGGGGMGVSAAPPPPVNGRVAAYQTTFYPGVTHVGQATLIALKSGESRTGVDWQVRPTGIARISGTITGSDGPAASLAVRLIAAPGSRDDDALPVATATTAADGSFVFFGVPTGQYIAKAQQQPRGGMAAGMPVDMIANLPPEAMALLQGRMGGSGDASFLRAPISVGDKDLSGLVLAVRPGAKVSGRVVFDGAAPPPNAQQLLNAQVSLAPIGGAGGGVGGGIGQLPKLTADGTFKTGSYPVGNYMLGITGIPGTWMLVSTMVGGRDAAPFGFEIGDTEVADVVVTFTDRVTSLMGTVAVEGTAPLPNTTVIMIPANYRAWLTAGARAGGQVTSPVQPTGAFNLGRPLPGDYLVAAALDEVLLTDHDAAFYDSLARVATRVTIGEGEKKTIELRILRSIR